MNVNLAISIVILLGSILTSFAFAGDFAEEGKKLKLSKRILVGLGAFLSFGLIRVAVNAAPQDYADLVFIVVLMTLGLVQLLIAGRDTDYSMTFVAYSVTVAILMWLTVSAAYRGKFFGIYLASTIFPIAMGLAKNAYFNKKMAGQLDQNIRFKPVIPIVVAIAALLVGSIIPLSFGAMAQLDNAAANLLPQNAEVSTSAVAVSKETTPKGETVAETAVAEVAEEESAAEFQEAVVALASDTNLTATPSANSGVELTADEEMERALTVDLAKYEELRNIYSEYPNKFIDSGMPNRYKEKKLMLQALIDKGVLKLKNPFSDAVSFPFGNTEEKKGVHANYKDEDLATMKEELILELKGNPVFLDMTLRGLKDVELTTDKTIGDLNPWMGEFVETMDRAMAHAMDIRTQLATINTNIALTHDEKKAEINKLDLHPRGNEYWLTVDPATGDYVTTITEDNVAGYNYYADRACMFIFDCCNCLGVDEYTSKVNYALQACMDADIARTECLDKKEQQDGLALLAFSYDRKNGDREILYGFNIFDKRFELFDRKAIPKRLEKPKTTPKQPKKQATPAPQVVVPPQQPIVIPQTPVVITPPSGGGGHGGGGNGGSGGGGGGGDTPTEKKDPTQDPVNQGNAPQGGGMNQPGDGTGVYQPTEPPHQDNDAPNGYNGGGSEASQPESEAGKHEETHNNEPVVNHDDNKDSSPTPVSDEDGGGKHSGHHNGSMSAPD